MATAIRLSASLVLDSTRKFKSPFLSSPFVPFSRTSSRSRSRSSLPSRSLFRFCELRRMGSKGYIRTCHLDCETGHLYLYDRSLYRGLGGRLSEERGHHGHGAAMGNGHFGVESDVQLVHVRAHVQNQSARMQMVEFWPTIINVNTEETTNGSQATSLPRFSRFRRIGHQCACCAFHGTHHPHHGDSHTPQRQTYFSVNDIRVDSIMDWIPLTDDWPRFEEPECRNGQDARSCRIGCQTFKLR